MCCNVCLSHKGHENKHKQTFRLEYGSVTYLPFKEIIINTKIHYRDKTNLTQFSWLRSAGRREHREMGERWSQRFRNLGFVDPNRTQVIYF